MSCDETIFSAPFLDGDEGRRKRFFVGAGSASLWLESI
jgi:hypothetical protein